METLVLSMLQAPARAGGGLISILPLVVLFFLFWIMIIVPQRRQAKTHAEMVAALQKGDQVVTAGGLIGTITMVRDDSVELRTGSSTVVVERARISRRAGEPAAPSRTPGA
ncbi:preprotein translocase subunit YajC [Longimicrobium sp.]|uniref:preprotein translocase subunit YajC n=1 Tax=Longimicrobium sp. TaxID=2029185 RepID=UPI002E30116B|nr:preprotein translocase subunit YajC [Longimicrobium sp.]HEX6041787.1 preprotein translocase subunit YajC [Longimicrobium sp.]